MEDLARRLAAASMIFSSTIAASPNPRPRATLGPRRHGRCERAGPLDERFGERLDVAPRHGAKQNKLDEFIFGQCVAAALAEPLAQPLTMTKIVRRRLGRLVLC